MKSKITLFIAMLFISITTMAQSPNIINYQGAARNTNGSAIANQNIKVRLKVHQGTTTGTVKYSEVRSLTTDASGLFTIQIGSAGATSTTGSWGAIKWETGAKFLQVEMDPTGGNNFVDMGTQQLLSVPYAQYANLADRFVTPLNLVDSTTLSTVIITNIKNTPGANAIYGSANGGAGVMGSSSLGNGVKGTSNAAYYGAVEGLNTVAGGKGVVGISNTGTNSMGVEGNANAGIGVSGYSNTNTGVQGGSISGTGVYGNTLTGSALKGISSSGYGLEISGKVKIAGGNTNPTSGAVLTSDAAGNATWQPQPKIAFRANSGTTNLPCNQVTKLNYTGEPYDLGSNFDLNTDIFTAPVTGIYSFSAANQIYLSSSIYNINNASMYLKVNRGGTEYNIAVTSGIIENLGSNGSESMLQINTTTSLIAGDQVYVKVYHYNSNGLTANTNVNDPAYTYFCGNLIY